MIVFYILLGAALSSLAVAFVALIAAFLLMPKRVPPP